MSDAPPPLPTYFETPKASPHPVSPRNATRRHWYSNSANTETLSKAVNGLSTYAFRPHLLFLRTAQSADSPHIGAWTGAWGPVQDNCFRALFVNFFTSMMMILCANIGQATVSFMLLIELSSITSVVRAAMYHTCTCTCEGSESSLLGVTPAFVNNSFVELL